MASFSRNSPISCDVEFDTKTIQHKTAIVTGGKFLNFLETTGIDLL